MIHNDRSIAAITFSDKKKVNLLTNQATTETVMVQQRQNKQEQKTDKYIL